MYLLDVVGAGGRPSHSKIGATLSFVSGTALVWFCALTQTPPSARLLALVALVFASVHGIQGLKLWFSSRAGGLADAVGTEAKAEIVSRRRDGGGEVERTD